MLSDRIPSLVRSDRPAAVKVDIELTRRRTLGTLVAALALAVNSGTPCDSAWAQTNLDAAASFIREVGGELAAIVGGDTSREEKRQRLQSLIDRTVAVDEIARFCLGRFWRLATPSQQQEYLQLFHSVLVTEVVVRLGDYHHEDVHIIVGHPEQSGDDTDVPSTVQRTGNPPAKVTWVLQSDSGSFKIVDLLAEGVSMRLTVRNDYDSFLESNNDKVAALLRGLRRQDQQNQS